jgi:hypothetical protein
MDDFDINGGKLYTHSAAQLLQGRFACIVPAREGKRASGSDGTDIYDSPLGRNEERTETLDHFKQTKYIDVKHAAHPGYIGVN